MLSLKVSLVFASLLFSVLTTPVREFYSDPSNYFILPVARNAVKITLQTEDAADIMLSSSNSSKDGTYYEIRLGHMNSYVNNNDFQTSHQYYNCPQRELTPDTTGIYTSIVKDYELKVISRTPNVITRSTLNNNTFIVFWNEATYPRVIGIIKEGSSWPFIIWEDESPNYEEITYIGFRMRRLNENNSAKINNAHGHWFVADLPQANVNMAFEKFIFYMNSAESNPTEITTNAYTSTTENSFNGYESTTEIPFLTTRYHYSG